MKQISSSHCQYLEWDSNIFGYPVYKITGVTSLSEVKSALSVAKFHKGRLVYFTLKSDTVVSDSDLLELGGNLVDEKVSLRIELEYIPSTDIDEQIISYESHATTPQLISLALQSGVYSRYSTDKHFSHGEYKKLYMEWIERSVRREIADDVFVYHLDGKDVGCITVGHTTEEAVIGLLAVDEAARGKSIGTKLLQHAIAYCKGLKYPSLSISTQKQNIAALNLYKKVGFQEFQSQAIYHFWLD